MLAIVFLIGIAVGLLLPMTAQKLLAIRAAVHLGTCGTCWNAHGGTRSKLDDPAVQLRLCAKGRLLLDRATDPDYL